MQQLLPRFVRLTLALMAVVLPADDAAAQSVTAAISSLEWLAGCWATEGTEQGSGEQWTIPAGETLLGVGRTVRGGKTVAHEFMQIREIAAGRIAFIALPSNQQETRFPLARLGENEVVFENTAHDFPHRVSYRLVDERTLLARIEGTIAGQLRGEDFPMRRTSCATQSPERLAARVWSFTVAAGAAAQNDRQDGHLALIGTHAAAALSRPVGRRLTFRLEALLTDFGTAIDHVHAPCPPDAPPSGCHSPVGAVRMRALTVGMGGGDRGERRYAVVGAGAYYLAAHPTLEGRTRPGLYAAYGRPLTGGRPSLTLEAQLHWLPNLSQGGELSMPVRMGLKF